MQLQLFCSEALDKLVEVLIFDQENFISQQHLQW